jgi:hypothetical protein
MHLLACGSCGMRSCCGRERSEEFEQKLQGGACCVASRAGLGTAAAAATAAAAVLAPACAHWKAVGGLRLRCCLLQYHTQSMPTARVGQWRMLHWLGHCVYTPLQIPNGCRLLIGWSWLSRIHGVLALQAMDRLWACGLVVCARRVEASC